MKNIVFKIFSLGLAGIIALTPITSHAVVRDNLSSMDTSATATSSDLLNGETAWVNGSKITGTMTDISSTQSATTIVENGTNALITIPTAGYYDASDKISVPITTIVNNVNIPTTNLSVTTYELGVRDMHTGPGTSDNYARPKWNTTVIPNYQTFNSSFILVPAGIEDADSSGDLQHFMPTFCTGSSATADAVRSGTLQTHHWNGDDSTHCTRMLLIAINPL